MMEQLAAELERLDPDPEVRCIVIAGSEEVFAAGADIKAMSERSFAEALAPPGRLVLAAPRGDEDADWSPPSPATRWAAAASWRWPAT